MDGVPEMGGIYGFGPTERNGLSNREGMETAGSRDLQSYGDLTGQLDDRLIPIVLLRAMYDILFRRNQPYGSFHIDNLA